MLCLPLAAQSDDWEVLSVPTAPPRRILDDARLFSTDPIRLRVLENRILEMSEKYELPIYVVFFDSLIGRTMGEEVVRLEDAWLGKNKGVLLAVETGNGQFWLLWSNAEPVSAEGEQEVPVLGKGVVPPHDQLLIDQKLQDLGRMPTGSVEHAERMVDILLTGIDESLIANQAESPGIKPWMVAAGLAVVVVVLAFGLVIARWTKKSDVHAYERWVFPDLEIEPRLGSAYCGGKIREMSFVSSSSS